MSKTYQAATESGLVIPQTVCASASLGDEVVTDIARGRTAIRPSRISAEEAQHRALRYALTNLGDALDVSVPELRGQGEDAIWCVSLKRQATQELCGEVHLWAESGEVIDWRPAGQQTKPATP